MRVDRVRRRMAVLVSAAVLVAAGVAGCQTRPEPRAWDDDFTGEEGRYVHATRGSGGYSVRFATSDARPDEVELRVRVTRAAVSGNRAYWVVDGERLETPMEVRTHTESARTRGGVMAGGSPGGGVRTGVGLTFGPSPVRQVYDVRIWVEADLAERVVEADEVRLRVGERPGATFTFDAETRERLGRLMGE